MREFADFTFACGAVSYSHGEGTPEVIPEEVDGPENDVGEVCLAYANPNTKKDCQMRGGMPCVCKPKHKKEGIAPLSRDRANSYLFRLSRAYTREFLSF